jgi:hypothetical protein
MRRESEIEKAHQNLHTLGIPHCCWHFEVALEKVKELTPPPELIPNTDEYLFTFHEGERN